MQEFRKTVFLMIPAFVIISFLATSSFAGHGDLGRDDYKEWQEDKWEADREWWEAEDEAQRKLEKDRRKAERKWRKAQRKHRRDWEREYHRDWRDEVRYSHGHHHPRDHHAIDHRGHYPDHGGHPWNHDIEHYPDRNYKRSSGGHNEPTIHGGVTIGGGVHIPFPNHHDRQKKTLPKKK